MTALAVLTLTAIVAYLAGAIPFGYLVARSRGVNLFEHGSGNVGATNVGRVLGKKYGILVFAFDFLKGAIPTLLAARLTSASELELPASTPAVTAGAAAVLGHVLPIFLRFHGGKGVATGAGVVAVLLPIPAILALLTWVVLVSATRFVSLSSMLAAVVLSLYQLTGTRFAFCPEHQMLNGFCLLVTLLVWARHKSNLQRLMNGNENRLRETVTMHQLTKVLHVLAMGLWFGMSAFFTFVVAFSLFETLQTAADRPKEKRENWFPIAKDYDENRFTSEKREEVKQSLKLRGSIAQEQGTRAAGYVIAPIFDSYFLLQTVCGFVAVITAFGWSTRFPQTVHKVRSWVALAALVTVGIGWWMEMKVTDLRGPRSQTTDRVLQSDNPTKEDLQAAMDARATFSSWHLTSVFVNLATVLLVTAGMMLAAWMPVLSKQETVNPRSADPVASSQLFD